MKTIERINNLIYYGGGFISLLGIILFFIYNKEIILIITVLGLFMVISEFAKLYLVAMGNYKFKESKE